MEQKLTAKKVFKEFWEKVKGDTCDRKTLASISFDAGHSLRHIQSEWINVKDAMPKEYARVLIHFKGKLSRLEGNVTEGWWNGEYWDCPAILVGSNEKITVLKWMKLPSA